MKRSHHFPRYLTPVIHVLFWAILYVLLNIRWFWGEGPRGPENLQYRFLVNSMVLIAFFYLNAGYLFPVLYKRKGWLVYIPVIIVTVFLLIELSDLVNNELFPLKRYGRGHRSGFFFFSIIPYVFMLGVSTSFRIVSDFTRQENEKLKTELTFLRSQISPHFMFNVLNSLVSLARKKSDLMEPSLIQLSGLMRYMLYESDDERITLEQEVGYLKSYIDLQLLRFGDGLDIEVSLPADCGNYEIEPMLLISLVENAFKHGIGAAQKPMIRISLSVDQDKDILSFEVENTSDPGNGVKDRNSGIGLNNMRRRLELLYKGRHTLEVIQHKNRYFSNLKIVLK